MGSKEFEIDLDKLKKGFKKTIKYTKGDLTLNLKGDSPMTEYSHKGNTVVVSVYNSDKTDLLGKIFLKTNSKKCSHIYLKTGETVDVLEYTYQTTTKGTWLNEDISGTKKNDKIITDGGNDTIFASVGKDKLVINGSGSKVFDFFTLILFATLGAMCLVASNDFLTMFVSAELLGISTNALSLIETGNGFLTAETLEKILTNLNIEPNELFSFDSLKSNEEIYDNYRLIFFGHYYYKIQIF